MKNRVINVRRSLTIALYIFSGFKKTTFAHLKSTHCDNQRLSARVRTTYCILENCFLFWHLFAFEKNKNGNNNTLRTVKLENGIYCKRAKDGLKGGLIEDPCFLEANFNNNCSTITKYSFISSSLLSLQ